MMFNNDDIIKISALVKERLSEKRFKHTLGVEKLAKHLGNIIMPDKVNELRVAALLHDIAKELTSEEHLDLLLASNVKYTDEDLSIKPALHSIAAVPLIIRDFPDFATQDVLSAVANHTLGFPEMSVFDEIIFISDYAEEGRTYRTCVEIRRYLLDNISSKKSIEENIRALHTASLKSIESTIESLTNRKEKINTKTIMTKKYLEKII